MDSIELLQWLQIQRSLAHDKAISSSRYDDRTLYFAKATAFEEVIDKLIGYEQSNDGEKQ